MYFAVSEISLDIWLVVGIGFVAGVLSGLFGIGGGIVSTPTLIALGVSPIHAVAASAHQIVGSSFTGLISRLKQTKESVDFYLGSLLAGFGFIGSKIGIYILSVISKIGNANVLISLGYFFVLGGIGLFMLTEAWKTISRHKSAYRLKYQDESESIIDKLPIRIYFPRYQKHISLIFIIFLGVFSGMLVSIMGVGGGFIIVPILFYALKIPHKTATGTSLFQVMLLTIQVTFLNVFYTGSLDIMLSGILMLGAVFGSQIGVYLSLKIKPEYQRLGLALLAISIAAASGFALVAPRSDLFEIKILNSPQ